MKTIEYVKDAISYLNKEVQIILFDMKLSQNDRDDLMLPLTRQKKVLVQTLEDLTYLKENPPTMQAGCKCGVEN
jgi:hypothetical protein